MTEPDRPRSADVEPTRRDRARAEEDTSALSRSDGVVANLPGGSRSDDRDERVQSGNVGREEPYEG